MGERVSLFLAIAVVAVVCAAGVAHAQDPSPASFMRDTLPGSMPPNDGAAVLVVEGQGAGVGGCASDLNAIISATVSSINAAHPTVTEISPQGPSNCGGATTQDWENVVLQLVTSVEDNAPGAPTWWGGVMLDEETGSGFGWSSSAQAAAAYEDLNASVDALMGSQQGITWYYTSTFSATGEWSPTDFALITGASHAAPLIATDYMVQLTNAWEAAMHETVLITWSLHSDYLLQPHGFYGSEFRINGAPLNQWGMNLSNCFTTGAELCDDWDGDGIHNASDPDNDNDHCPDVDEPALGLDPLDPWDFYSVPAPALITNPSSVADNAIGVTSDLLALLAYNGRTSTSADYTADRDNNRIEDGLQYDRSDLGTKPGPPDGGIGSSTDVLAMEREIPSVC